MTWEQQWHRPSVLPSFSPTYTPQTETSHCFFRWHQRSLLQVSRQTDTHTKWQMSILTPPKANFFLGKTAGSFGPPKNIWFLYQASDQNPFLPCLFSLQNDFVVFLKAKSPNCAPNHSCTIWETSSSDPEINITFWSITTHLNHFQKSYFFQQQLLALQWMIFSSLQMFGSADWQNIIRKLSVHPDLGAQRALLVTHNCTPTDRCISVCCKGSDHFSTSEARGSNKIPVTLQPG